VSLYVCAAKLRLNNSLTLWSAHGQLRLNYNFVLEYLLIHYLEVPIEAEYLVEAFGDKAVLDIRELHAPTALPHLDLVLGGTLQEKVYLGLVQRLNK
jgi:hypothetical protein